MPIIYLSPSTQDWNQYVNGGTEEEWMNLLADKMVPMLGAGGQVYNGHNDAPPNFSPSYENLVKLVQPRTGFDVYIDRDSL